MVGFTIKCNKCGKSIICTSETNDKCTKDELPIHIGGGYGGEVSICCKCGNNFDEDYDCMIEGE